MWWRSASGALLVIVALAGCATSATSVGSSLLREGRPSEAIEHFQKALAEDPHNVEAKVGLGAARYRLGAYDDAIAELTDAATQMPGYPAARLYLALAHLRKRQDKDTERELEALRTLALEPRFIAEVDQTLALLRAGGITDAVRTYIAASLDYAFDWSNELAETRRALRNADLAWDPFWGRPIYVIRCRNC
jgi:tetratricopeptide (TPR) repeat protein